MWQVFEAYCLVVLRIGGPSPRPVPGGQLAAAGEAYWSAVVAPAAAGRVQLQAALAAAGLLPAGRGLSQPSDGHLLLFDVVVPGDNVMQVLAAARRQNSTTRSRGGGGSN